MKTTIGQAFRRSHKAMVLTSVAAVGIVALDLSAARTSVLDMIRLVAVSAALIVYGLTVKWDRHSLGLRFTPRQGWLYWLKVTLILGGIITVFILVVTGVAIAFRVDLSKYRLFRSPSDFWRWTPYACLVAPILEEGIYRFVLCTPTTTIAKPWVVILLSGCAFAGLHFVYGNPSPDNFLAGFLLAWAYLKSGSILVPIGLHSLGNLCVGLVSVAECYWYG